MTARRSSAGRCRRRACRCRDALLKRSASSAARRRTCAVRAAPMPACTRGDRSRILTSRRTWPTDTVRDAVNFHLKPDPIAVLECDARRGRFRCAVSAVARHYVYRIVARRGTLALDRNSVWRVPHALDGGAMHAAAQVLVGRHDFTTFRAAGCQARSPVKTLDRLDVTGDGMRCASRRRRARSCITRCAR